MQDQLAGQGNTLSFPHRSLVQQGYTQFTPSQLREIEWGLRFTPTVCALIAIYGLATQQPWVLFTVAGLGIWAFLFPAAHPMDLVYNSAVRPLLGAAKLPPNPLQRRLACLSAGFMNILAGSLFLLGQPTAALAVGACLIVLQAIVIASHFCVLSWVYEGVARMLGSWNRPLEPAQAQQLLRGGATIVDVRTAQEYAQQHIPGALNLPLESLSENLHRLPSGTLLLHCKSGMRSNMATGLLRKNGYREIYNLGGFERARSIVETCQPPSP
jgi:rhodanese-related sulfurtransferase